MSGDDWDVVVIGAGLGGLACATGLARAGASVLVVEQQDRAGGLAGSFVREGFDFELSLHLMDAMGPGDPNGWLLEQLGVAEGLELRRPEPQRREIWPEHDLSIPVGIEPWCELMSGNFPQQRAGLGELARIAEQVHQAYQHAADLTAVSAQGTALAGVARRTAADVLKERIADPRLLTMLDVYARGWLGLPLAELAAPSFLVPWYSFQAFGGYVPRGGSAALVQALVEQIEGHGGQVALGCGVERIVVERGRACGVELGGDRRVRARAVVSNASPEHTFGVLCDQDALDGRYTRRLSRIEPSVACVKIWLGSRPKPGQARPTDYDVLLCSSYDEPTAEVDPLRHALSVIRPTALHSSSDQDVVSVTMLVQPDCWKRERAREPRLVEQLVEVLLDRVAQSVWPDLRGSATAQVVATPETFERFTGHPGGAIYGGHRRMGSSGGWRLEAETPVAGLWLVGAWIHPGAGVSSVLSSGCRVAERVLQRLAQHGQRRSGG